jgi:hypothetical protein
MKPVQVMQEVLDGLRVVPPDWAEASSRHLRALAMTRPRGPGRWDLTVTVTPNDASVSGQSLRQLSVSLVRDGGSGMTPAKRSTRPGVYEFEDLGAGQYHLIATDALAVWFKDIARKLNDSFASHPTLARALGAKSHRSQSEEVVLFSSSADGEISDGSISWSLNTEEGSRELTFATKDRRLAGRQMRVRFGEQERTVCFSVRGATLTGTATGVPTGALPSVEIVEDDEKNGR